MKMPDVVDRMHKVKEENNAEREWLKREREAAAAGPVYSPWRREGSSVWFGFDKTAYNDGKWINEMPSMYSIDDTTYTDDPKNQGPTFK